MTMNRPELTFAEVTAALKVFSYLCDKQPHLTAATVRAELDRIIAVVGIGEIQVAVGQAARNERHEAMMHDRGYSPLYPEHAARWARCEQAARLLGLPEAGESLGCGGSPDELAAAYIRAFENRGQTDPRTAEVLHRAGVHKIDLGADVVVPVLPAMHAGASGMPQTPGVACA